MPHVFYALLYLGTMAVCLLFIIKPGASIFYFKTSHDSQAVILDPGHFFRYDLDITPFILNTFAWSSGEALRYTTPCSEDSPPSFDEIKQAATQRLLKDGFDVSPLA